MGENLARKEYRKVTKIGNSLSVTIPKDIAEKLNIKQGDLIEFTPSNQGAFIKPAQTIPDNVDPRLVQSLNKIFADYDQTFKNLRDR
jgi:putative addiction module antidote